MEIDVIGSQKQNVILEILQLAHHNPEINWKTEEVRMMRCPEECERQWRLKQGKSVWQKQKEEEKAGRKQDKKKKEKEKKEKKEKTINVKRIAEEWKIWDKEEEVVKSEEKVKKLVLEYFHKWIHIFGKKQSERMPTRKL